MPASAALLRGWFGDKYASSGPPTTPRVGRWVTDPEGKAALVGGTLLWDCALPSDGLRPCAGEVWDVEGTGMPMADPGVVFAMEVRAGWVGAVAEKPAAVPVG